MLLITFVRKYSFEALDFVLWYHLFGMVQTYKVMTNEESVQPSYL